MFNVDKIYTDLSGNRFLCDCLCNSERAAKYIEASLLMSVRANYFAVDLYVKGNKVILDTPNKEKTIALITLLNDAIIKIH